MHPMALLGDEAQVEARFSPFGDTTNLGCTRMYSGSEIVLDAPDISPRWRELCGISIQSVWR
jgi:hypothetical protein